MKNKSNVIRNIFFALGVLVIFIMVYSLGFDVIYENLKNTGWWFFAIVGIWIVVYAVNAISFHIIIRDGSEETKQIKFLRTLKIVISGYAINYTTPMGLLGGEPYRILELKPALGTKKATSSVLLYAMMHFVSHFILWLLCVPLLMITVKHISLGVEIVLWSVLVGSVALIYWSFKVYRKGVIGRLLALRACIPFVKKRIKEYSLKNKEHVEEMDQLIAHLYNNRKKAFYASLGAELCARFIACMEVFIMIYSIGYEITYIQCVVIVGFASLFANLLFFSPMQLGTREGGYALALSSLSITSGIGVYVSLCTRVRELFWIAVGIAIMKYKSLK